MKRYFSMLFVFVLSFSLLLATPTTGKVHAEGAQIDTSKLYYLVPEHNLKRALTYQVSASNWDYVRVSGRDGSSEKYPVGTPVRLIDKGDNQYVIQMQQSTHGGYNSFTINHSNWSPWYNYIYLDRESSAQKWTFKPYQDGYKIEHENNAWYLNIVGSGLANDSREWVVVSQTAEKFFLVPAE
ncbi:hypothetical protein MK805_03685 [Shimazuella sp. AN120528]|nr:hypothetical protein [Shimazuella soli]